MNNEILLRNRCHDFAKSLLIRLYSRESDLTKSLPLVADACDLNSFAYEISHLLSTLPAFISPNVLNYLVEHYHIAPIITPEQDIKVLLGNTTKLEFPTIHQ